VLTCFFNLLYGPVEVAPLHVTDDLHAPGTRLDVYWISAPSRLFC
jgi:hypothetical protein